MIRYCVTNGCKNRCKQYGTVCSSCASRVYRQNHPVRYAYNTLKTNAKRRGKEFTITFEYFQQFCYETNYIAGKGRSKISYSVDRIDESKGYVPGNLQVLSLSENIKKYLKYDFQNKTAIVEKQIKNEKDEWFDK